MKNNDQKKILLIDDQAMVREGIRYFFAKQHGMVIMSETDSIDAGRELWKEKLPDIVILGISESRRDIVQFVQEIIKSDSHAKVVVIVRQMEPRFLEEILRSGASAYLIKNSSFDELYSAIKAVVQGHTYITPEIAEVVIRGYCDIDGGDRMEREPGLSSRECEVLTSICEGKGTREIGGFLDISIKTVETHRRRIMEKLGIETTAGLIKYAIKKGITSV